MIYFLCTGDGSYSSADLLEDAKATKKQILNLAEATKDQANSALWNAHRRCRVTASNCFRIVQSKEPGTSALRAIMQYNMYSLSRVPAVKWGIEHEAIAREQFCEYMSKTHDDFSCQVIGLVLHPTFPFLAASPDGLVRCKCHGCATLEIKCTYKYRDVSPDDPAALVDSNYFLNKDGLKSKHKYYCQVQTQMLVTNSKLCYFVVWTNNGFSIEEIEKSESYHENILTKVKKFVDLQLIPELVSRKLQFQMESTEACDDGKLYCSCKKPSYGKMINCENDDCSTEWYHYSCVGLKRKPKGNWFCPECKK